jgi:hypothetical protein
VSEDMRQLQDLDILIVLQTSYCTLRLYCTVQLQNTQSPAATGGNDVALFKGLFDCCCCNARYARLQCSAFCCDDSMLRVEQCQRPEPGHKSQGCNRSRLSLSLSSSHHQLSISESQPDTMPAPTTKPVRSAVAVGRGGGNNPPSNPNPAPQNQNQGVAAAPTIPGVVIITAPPSPPPGQQARQPRYGLMIQRAPGQPWTPLQRGTPGTAQVTELFAVRSPPSNAWIEGHAPGPGESDKNVNVWVNLQRSLNGRQANAAIRPR